MSGDHIEEHSCLLETQHGAEEEMEPLSEEEVTKATMLLTAEEDGAEEEQLGVAMAARSGVGRPQIHRVYQAKAATRRNRSNAQIDQIVIHTPEGYEGGTLAVLQNGRAGFDWYLPPSGNLYKCNAFAKYVAWQAGYWPSNLRSIGIEQYDFAANMGNAPDAHYRRLAHLVAWLTQLLDIPVRHAAWNEPGLVAHAQITPKSRTDPGRDFDWEKLIRFTKEARGKGSGSPAPEKPGETQILYRPRSGLFSTQSAADALAQEQRAKGLPASAEPRGDDWATYNGAFGRYAGAASVLNRVRNAGYRDAFIETVKKA